MRILDLKDGKVIVSAEALNVPEFNALYLRDLTKTKAQALAELSYVFYISDPNSPYANYSDDKKARMLGEDMFKDQKYKPDQRVIDAITKYKLLQETPISRLLKAVEAKTDELAEFLNNTPLTSATLKEILAVMEKATPLVTKAGELRAAAEKEQKVRGRVRGQIEIGDYER